MHDDLIARAKAWLAEDPDPETRAELGALIDAADTAELLDALRPDGVWSVPRDAGLCEDRRRS